LRAREAYLAVIAV